MGAYALSSTHRRERWGSPLAEPVVGALARETFACMNDNAAMVAGAAVAGLVAADPQLVSRCSPSRCAGALAEVLDGLAELVSVRYDPLDARLAAMRFRLESVGCSSSDIRTLGWCVREALSQVCGELDRDHDEALRELWTDMLATRATL